MRIYSPDRGSLLVTTGSDGASYTLPGTIEDVAPVESVRKALESVGYPPK